VSFLCPVEEFDKTMCSCSYLCPLARDGTSKLPRNPGSLMGHGELADCEYSMAVSSECGVSKASWQNGSDILAGFACRG